MKKIIIIIVLVASFNVAFSKGYKKYNPYKKPEPKSLIIPIALKTIGFGLMSYSNHKDRINLNVPKQMSPTYKVGLIMFTASIPFDVNNLCKKSKKR